MKEIERYIQFAIDNGYDLFRSFELVENFEQRDSSLYDSTRVYGICISIESFNDIDENLYPINNIITSKPFIEAVARGIRKTLKQTETLDNNYKEIDIEKFNKQTKYIYLERVGVNRFNDIYSRDEKKTQFKLERIITLQQAIAIRDEKLEEFIKPLLPLLPKE